MPETRTRRSSKASLPSPTPYAQPIHLPPPEAGAQLPPTLPPVLSRLLLVCLFCHPSVYQEQQGLAARTSLGKKFWHPASKWKVAQSLSHLTFDISPLSISLPKEI